MDVYRKSYTAFVIWMVVFIAVLLMICFLPADDPALIMRLLVVLCTAGMAQLSWMIWRTERVYWYNGITFEDAEKAGSERRKEYALRHFRLFGRYAVITLAVAIGAHLLHIPWWIDFTVVMVGLVAAAFRTLGYRL